MASKKTRDTSDAAAQSIAESAGDLRALILDSITAADNGLTCAEIEEHLDLRHQTASARINELSKAGSIVDSGARRPTPSGRDAIVWTAEAKALAARPPAFPIIASESDVFAFLRGLKGANLNGCITDLPYPTLERHRARGTTTRLKASDASSNPWFRTLSIPQLAEVLGLLYDVLAPNAYAFVYVDDPTYLLLAHELGVPEALLQILYKPTSAAPRDRIGFGWWNPATWVKTSTAFPEKPRGGSGYHGGPCTERILILEKGKSQLKERFDNAFLKPRVLHPKGATLKSATAKPIDIAETLTRAMSAPGGRIVDPFVGCGTHAEGIGRAGCQAVVNDINLNTFRDWTANVFRREWLEPVGGQWERRTSFIPTAIDTVNEPANMEPEV